MSRAPRPLLAALLLFAAPAAVRAGPEAPTLVNGDFASWQDGKPAGWEVEIGANRGEGPASVIRMARGGGVALDVRSADRRLLMLTQSVDLDPKATYRLRFEAGAHGLRLEAGQSDNAYVGARGSDGTWWTARIDESASSPGEVVLPPRTGDRIRVCVFLSKTGSLEVRSIRLERVAREESFSLLSKALLRSYSYLDLKQVDGPALVRKFEPRGASASEEGAFIDVVREMLAELKDTHVWITRSDGKVVPTWVPEIPRNYDYRAVGRSLQNVSQIGTVAFSGTAGEDVGVLAIGSLQYDDATQTKILEALESLLDKKGILLDLRGNSGGDERKAQAIAAVFADQPRVYARSKSRAGPRPTDFTEPVDRWVRPREGRRFTGPVVVLIGPGCVSSGEGFVKAMRVLPNVTLVGQNTRGASGSPAPVDLPNGVSVWFSRWVDMLPDGTIVEGKGVPPDVVVKHEGEGDPTFRAALEVLRAKTGKEAPR